jgi:hypothetical protein
MEPIRIVLVDMPRVLREIVRMHLPEPEFEVVAELGEEAPLLPVVDEHGAHAVIFGTDSAGLPQVGRDLLAACPFVKLLAVASDGRRTTLYELRPHKQPLGEISPDRLAEVIRDSLAQTVAAW